jgi:dihydroorotate dehydrogenase (NAD+) catalytic subunit
MAADMAVSIGSLRLAHPVINGSGTFDAIAARRAFGEELLARFPFSAFVSKTITPESRIGNPPPRLWESPSGLINSIGLPNKGLEGFLAEDLPRLRELPVPLIVSVMATDRDEFAHLVDAVGGREEVGAIELNISCPNVESGLIVGADPDETRALMEAVRPLTPKPLIVKLTPNVTDPRPVAEAAEQGGADAVSLLNTLKAYAAHPSGGGPWLGGETGGLSGPAIRSVGLAQVRGVAGRVSIPIIGIGGIATGSDAMAYLVAGADVIAVGTESFRDPAAGLRIASDLQVELEGRNAESAEDFCKERRTALRSSTARI